MTKAEIIATEYLEELLAAISGDDRGAFFAELWNLIECGKHDVLPDVETAVENWREREGL